MVALKLVPAKDEAAKALLKQYSVKGYPTLLLADAAGNEIDRLGSFMPPETLLSEIARIESGDTFFTRLERFGESPADPVLLDQVVDGYALRGDFAAIYRSIDAFQASGHSLDSDPSVPHLLRIMAFEHGMLYGSAARRFRDEWQELPDVSESRSTPALAAFLEEPLGEMAREEQARRLREARQEDANRLLAMMPEEGLADEMVREAASFAVENGLYDSAASLYQRWYERAGENAASGDLNAAAWDLYLCGKSTELALEMARAAYAGDSSPNVGDTLARLLYVSGAVEEGIAIQSKAATDSEGHSEEYAKAVELMKAGEELGDKPSFESYPEG